MVGGARCVLVTDSVILSDGLVLTPDGPQILDVLVEDGLVVRVAPQISGEPRLDCSGCWVGPGFVDLHTHLREPGQEHKEDMASGAAAGAAGGYTALMAMPNTSPAIDTEERARSAIARSRQIDALEIAVSGAVTAGRAGQELAGLEGMLAAGVRWFTDDGDSVASGDLLRAALKQLHPFGAIVSEHAEDPEQTVGGVMHQGEVAELLGVAGMPASAEAAVIIRDLEVMRRTEGRVHMQHVSTAEGVGLISRAKAEGLALTAEVTPHHLAFDHTELKARDPRFKMKPPLREPGDVQAVREGLRSGVIDIVATDHAPHSPEETEQAGLEGGAFGVIGLETAAAVVLTATELDMATFFHRLSISPARIGRFADHGRRVAVGSPANLVVFDSTATWIPQTFQSRSRNSPFLGRPLRGRVLATLFRGELTYEAGRTDG